MRHGGRPLLAVLSANKNGIFVKQRLRLFALAASRNRVGAPPLLAVDTECPMWHESTLGLADADGDGRDDLVLVCQTGLIDPELRLELYRGTGGGRFEPRARAVELDGEYESWTFAADWTGDRLPDLAAVRGGALEIHTGSGRRRPLDKRPAAVLELDDSAAAGPGFDVVVSTGDEGSSEDGVSAGDGSGRRVAIRSSALLVLGTADLTGDGRPELVVHRVGEDGDVVTVLSPR